MAGINKVIIIGNLGRDPEIRYTQNGTAVCSLNIATTRNYQKGGQGGERVEETEWHRVSVWGKQAEFCNQYLAKGRQCYVEGRLQTRNYEDKDGVKRYTTEIVAETVQFLGGKGGGDVDRSGDMDQRGWGGRGGSGKGGSSKGGGRKEPEPYGGGYDNYIPEPSDDDIPFD